MQCRSHRLSGACLGVISRTANQSLSKALRKLCSVWPREHDSADMPMSRRSGHEWVDDRDFGKSPLGVEHLDADSREDIESNLISCHQIGDRSVHPELERDVMIIELGRANE